MVVLTQTHKVLSRGATQHGLAFTVALIIAALVSIAMLVLALMEIHRENRNQNQNRK